MEIHPGIKTDNFTTEIPLTEFFERAKAYVELYMSNSLRHYRSIKFEALTPEKFWHEYVWCVYTSGFNAKIVSQKIGGLLRAYGSFETTNEMTWPAVKALIANKRKFEAIQATARRIRKFGWEEFYKKFIKNAPHTLPVGCAYVGDITKYHLARNIGIDCVKPDLHLTRLATVYNYSSCIDLCQNLAETYHERLGVVDFILWAYCASER